MNEQSLLSCPPSLLSCPPSVLFFFLYDDGDGGGGDDDEDDDNDGDDGPRDDDCGDDGADAESADTVDLSSVIAIRAFWHPSPPYRAPQAPPLLRSLPRVSPWLLSSFLESSLSFLARQQTKNDVLFLM